LVALVLSVFVSVFVDPGSVDDELDRLSVR
jgi:hypothetical protein